MEDYKKLTDVAVQIQEILDINNMRMGFRNNQVVVEKVLINTTDVPMYVGLYGFAQGYY